MNAMKNTTNEALATVSHGGGKYLTFTLAKEGYGIGILKIKEIIGMMPITPIPESPAHLKGVINLRGKVIPVIDLRLRFGMDAGEYGERTCIIVVEIADAARTRPVGVVVDAVSEVLHIKSEEIEDTPMFANHSDMGYILGMAKTEAGVKILLDIDRVLNSYDLAVPGREGGGST